jgi:hypothetical protein
MFKKINGEVEFDFEAFFESIREYKEFIRRRYSESIEIVEEKKALQHSYDVLRTHNS